jgi:hypothetical protein
MTMARATRTSRLEKQPARDLGGSRETRGGEHLLPVLGGVVPRVTAVLTPAQSIVEDIAIQQVELVESVVRRQAALFSDGLRFLTTPPPQLEGFWAEAKALKAAGDPSRADAMALWEKYFGDVTDVTTDRVDGD